MVKAELERFKTIGVLPMFSKSASGESVHNIPLKWWSVRAPEFPNIALFARRVLAVQATSAPVERLFSTAGNVISKKRTRLCDSMAADLIMLHDSWPA